MHKVRLKLSSVLRSGETPAKVEIVITTEKNITDVIDLSCQLFADGIRMLLKPIYPDKSTTPPVIQLTDIIQLKESLLDSVKQFTDVQHMGNANSLHIQRAGNRHRVTYVLAICKVEGDKQ